MIFVKIYYDDKSEQEAKQLYGLIRQISKERTNVGSQEINIIEFSNDMKKINDYEIKEFPCLIINDKVIPKKKFFGKTIGYTKSYIENKIVSTY